MRFVLDVADPVDVAMAASLSTQIKLSLSRIESGHGKAKVISQNNLRKQRKFCAYMERATYSASANEIVLTVCRLLSQYTGEPFVDWRVSRSPTPSESAAAHSVQGSGTQSVSILGQIISFDEVPVKYRSTRFAPFR